MACYAIPAQIGSAAFFFVVGLSWTGRVSWRHGSSSHGLSQFERSMSQRGGWHFPKDRTVIRSEAAKVRELVTLGNLRYTCCRRVSTLQRRTYHVESPQPNIAAGAHAQELHATCLQGPLRHANNIAKCRYARPSIDMSCQCVLEAEHDLGMMSLGRQGAVGVVGRQASHKRVDQLLLKRSRRLMLCNNLGFRLGDAAGTR